MAGIQGTGGLANEAFRAALKAQQDTARQMGLGQNPIQSPGQGQIAGLPDATNGPAGIGAVAPNAPTSFAQKLEAGLGEVTKAVQTTESMPKTMVQGEVGEFHEVALQLKQSDLSFRFALQVRNKLIDAYREVMRMSV
jgi:flagellar hook-basal body complex protein FliE